MFDDENATLDKFATKVHKKDLFISEKSKNIEHAEYNPYVNNNGTVIGKLDIL
jgi:hypothetical protein